MSEKDIDLKFLKYFPRHKLADVSLENEKKNFTQFQPLKLSPLAANNK